MLSTPLRQVLLAGMALFVAARLENVVPFRLLVLLLFLTFLPRCQFKSLLTPTNLRLMIEYEPHELDWTRARNDPARLITLQVMEGLFAHGAGGEVVPNHAASFDLKDKTVTITLRRGILWNDGVALTAHHYVDAWTRVLNPKNASPWAHHLFGIAGAKEWNRYQKGGPETLGLKAKGAYTLEVQLVETQGFLKELLTQPFTFPVRADALKKLKNVWTRLEDVPTLGPFQVSTWVPHTKVILKRNPAYHAATPRLSQLTFFVVADAGSAITLFDMGKLDILPSLEEIETSRRKTSAAFVKVPMLRSHYLGFNMKGVTGDARIRKAIAHAINEKQVVEATQMPHHPQKHLVPQQQTSPQQTGLHFDPAKAQQLLQAAGFPNGRNFPKMRFVLRRHPSQLKVAQEIRTQLHQNLNVTLDLNQVEWEIYLTTLRDGQADVWRMSRTALAAPHDILKPSIAHWSNQLYNRLIAEALTLPSPKHRKPLFDRAEKILLEDHAVLVPLYSEVRSALIKPFVKDVHISKAGDFVFSKTWIDSHQL